jgi:hypothetical protein
MKGRILKNKAQSPNLYISNCARQNYGQSLDPGLPGTGLPGGGGRIWGWARPA